jgi:hypothetical protein
MVKVACGSDVAPAKIVDGYAAVAANPSYIPNFFDLYWERFIEEPMSGCWLWFWSQTSMGYGNLTYRKKSYYAHRCSFEEMNGDGSSVGYQVRHRCDNPSCVNPDHLIKGSPVENYADAKGRGRLNVAFGERSGKAVLTTELVIAMRSQAASGLSIKEISELFDANRNTVESCLIGGTWGHIPGAIPRNSIKKIKPNPPHGSREAAPNSILTQVDVDQIKSRLALGETGRSLAAQFGVSPVTISAIKVGRIWNRG